jgi:hypothetical protein
MLITVEYRSPSEDAAGRLHSGAARYPLCPPSLTYRSSRNDRHMFTTATWTIVCIHITNELMIHDSTNDLSSSVNTIDDRIVLYLVFTAVSGDLEHGPPGLTSVVSPPQQHLKTSGSRRCVCKYTDLG